MRWRFRVENVTIKLRIKLHYYQLHSKILNAFCLFINFSNKKSIKWHIFEPMNKGDRHTSGLHTHSVCHIFAFDGTYWLDKKLGIKSNF